MFFRQKYLDNSKIILIFVVLKQIKMRYETDFI